MKIDPIAAERRKLHDEFRAHLWSAGASNTEQFDKAILTLSSAGLALSVSLLQIIGLGAGKVLLVGSWVAFITAILMTLISFLTSQRAIANQLDYADKYYLEGRDEYAVKSNHAARATEWLGYLAGLAFIIAVILSVLFAGMNLPVGVIND